MRKKRERIRMLKKCKNHLGSVEESYFQHMKFALKYSFCCFKAGFMSLIHAFFPCCFMSSASQTIKKLAGCVDGKDNRQDFIQ
jgi:hypothetical protein